jgi:cyclopropane-fatty-acyl-phospholipid synthase
LARRVSLWLLAKLRHGRLTVVEDRHTFTFGESPGQAGLHATITILNPRAYLRLLLGGSRGLGEAYVSGWWSADDLTAVIRIFTQNIYLLEKILSIWVRLAAPFYRFRQFPCFWTTP